MIIIEKNDQKDVMAITTVEGEDRHYFSFAIGHRIDMSKISKQLKQDHPAYEELKDIYRRLQELGQKIYETTDEA